MFDGIIFDVDGTLWDSTPVVEDAWNQAIVDFGVKDVRITADRLKGLFGLPMEDIIADILPDVPYDKRVEFEPLCFEYEHRYLSERAGILYPHIKEMFEGIKELGHSISIVSNCQAGYIELFLEKTGFGHLVDDHLCPGDTGEHKAQNILKICERNNYKNPVYVGDTQMDANACKEAGVPIIFASYGFGKVEAPLDVINKPTDLIELLKKY